MPNSYDITSCSCFILTQHPDHILIVKCCVVVRNLTITHITSVEYLKMDGDIATSLPKRWKLMQPKFLQDTQNEK